MSRLGSNITTRAARVDPVGSSTVYRNSDGTGAQTTSYAYTWYAGTIEAGIVTV